MKTVASPATRPRPTRAGQHQAKADTAAAKEAINAAIELFHRRWVLRILWELRGQAHTFRSLQAACDEVSPTVLNTRLSELREARLVEHQAGLGYALTPWGQELLVAIQPMLMWAVRWHGANKG